MAVEPLVDQEALAHECRAFTAYLTGLAPTPYVLEKYRLGHGRIPYLTQEPPERVDRLLLGAARHDSLLLRCADAYARILRPTGMLRQKLVLALAVLENSPPTHLRLNSAREGSPAVLALGVLGRALGFSLTLFIGLLMFGPLHLVAALIPDQRKATVDRG
ncbi:MAG TPA: hypothetical protein VFU03_04855 [Gemmatimonadales bacterium]|nr:hypothetical protein [Gemmatimonadales bacterium]